MSIVSVVVTVIIVVLVPGVVVIPIAAVSIPVVPTTSVPLPVVIITIRFVTSIRVLICCYWCCCNGGAGGLCKPVWDIRGGLIRRLLCGVVRASGRRNCGMRGMRRLFIRLGMMTSLLVDLREPKTSVRRRKRFRILHNGLVLSFV